MVPSSIMCTDDTSPLQLYCMFMWILATLACSLMPSSSLFYNNWIYFVIFICYTRKLFINWTLVGQLMNHLQPYFMLMWKLAAIAYSFILPWNVFYNNQIFFRAISYICKLFIKLNPSGPNCKLFTAVFYVHVNTSCSGVFIHANMHCI